MSSIDKRTVAGISLRSDKPTNVAVRRLFGWVIWQFPHLQKNGYLGAIRPPGAGHNWLPAVIFSDKDRVRVYGNITEEYASPEKALAFFHKENAT